MGLDPSRNPVGVFWQWCDALIARRPEAADDGVPVLVAVGDERLTDVELRNLVPGVPAGVCSTHAQLAHAVQLFADDPDHRALADRRERSRSCCCTSRPRLSGLRLRAEARYATPVGAASRDARFTRLAPTSAHPTTGAMPPTSAHPTTGAMPPTRNGSRL